jgi:hypothetical protein
MFCKKQFTLAILCFLIFKTQAQEIIYDATLNYTVSVNSDKDKNISKLFEGATFKIYLKGLLSKTELKTSLGTETSIYDGKENRGAILKEYSNQKLMIPMNEGNWKEKNKSFHTLQFKEEKNNIDINGVSCKKATAVNSKGEIIVVYFNPAIIFSNKEYNNCFTSISGIPFRYEQQMTNGTKYIYSLINIDYDIVTSNKFELPKSGYRIISYEEATKIEN